LALSKPFTASQLVSAVRTLLDLPKGGMHAQ
jgi:hypothetical protein